MVHSTNHIKQISNICCDFSVVLFNLYGISINNRFYPLLLRMVYHTKSFTSVGLARCPNYATTTIGMWCLHQKFLTFHNLFIVYTHPMVIMPQYDVVDRNWDVFDEFRSILAQMGLSLAYCEFVHPVAEYGDILLMGASATQLSKLDRMQHFAEQLYSSSFVPLQRCRHAAAIGLLCKLLDDTC